MNCVVTLRTVTIACILLCSAPLQADIVGVAVGSGWPPPDALGPYDLTSFDDDPRPTPGYVTDVPSPLGGAVAFSVSAYHFEYAHFPAGGDFYHADELFTITLPPETRAFTLWVNIDTGATQTATVIADGQTSVTQTIDSFMFAVCYGFYVNDPTQTISTLEVHTSSDVGRSVGHFSVAIPEPATICLLALPLLLRRR